MKNILFLLCLLGFWATPQTELSAQCNPDIDPPTPVCFVGLTVALNQAGEAVVQATDVNAGSFDNCTADALLFYSFDAAGTETSRTYTAEGTYDITLHVKDEAGNLDSCLTQLIIGCTEALACDDRVTVDVPAGDMLEVHYNQVLEGGPYCADAVFSFSPTDPDDTTVTVNGSNPLPTPYTVYNITTGNSCFGSIVNCPNEVPVAVCNSFLNVSLDQNGKAIITPLIIDQGSFSNCGPVELFLRRNGSPGECDSPLNPWRQEVTMCCSDVGDTIVIELLVRGSNGNESTCWAELLIEDKLGLTKDCSSIQGFIYKDDNDNCTPDNGEDSLEQVLVVVTDGVNEYVGYSDPSGYYRVFAPFGNYDVYAVSPGFYWGVCPNFVQVTLDSANALLDQNFGLNEVVECPLLNVDVVLQRLRRCFENNGYINYINTGTITALDAYIDVTLDPGLSLVSASAPYTSNGGGSYTFEVGDVPPFEGKTINISVLPLCDSTEIGQTKCVEAIILPDTICGELLDWSGANVEVTAECEGDSVRFTLKNTGSEDMKSARDYHVIEDDVIMFMKNFKLNKEEEMSFAVFSDGATMRLNAQQEIDHPYPFIQSVALEGCDDGGTFQAGFMRMFPMGNLEPNKDIECLELIGAYDPNEKAASPEGYGVENYLEPGNPITYTLYFQNTGNDTAFNVFILDTLSEHLDMKTFEPGASSHPVDILFQEERAIRFDFSNIMLPDSFVNEPASNGFVQFTITPKEDLPLPTWITNKVGIYFDFNDPVITNTVHHTIDTGFLEISTSVDWWNLDLETVEVFPVPATDVVHWEWSSDINVEGEIIISDLLGKTVMTQKVNGSRINMNLGLLQQGHYLYQIKDNDALFATGKILVKNP